MAPLRGIRVLEVSLGVSAVGAGLAVSLPGSLLRDFGAEVARVQSARASTLDEGIEFAGTGTAARRSSRSMTTTRSGRRKRSSTAPAKATCCSSPAASG